MIMKKKEQGNLIKQQEQNVIKFRDTYAQKYPALFALGATFGLVSILYGFEKIIDRLDFFANNPWVLLATGVTLLLITVACCRKFR